MNRFYLPTWCFVLMLCLGLPLAGRAQQSVSIAGTVMTDAGTPLAGATIIIKNTYLGTSTNEEGQFFISDPRNKFPLLLVVGYVGYGTEQITLEQANSSLEVTLRPTKVLEQVIVAASRREESIGQAPVTVEKLDRQRLGQFNTPDFGSSLNRLKGVNVAGSGILASSFSTRAFNSGTGSRVVQLSDYMDTQLPSFSANIGNLFGTPALDIASVEILHGPASALYGANAFNGVLLTNSRDPFLDPGLTVSLRGGNRSYFDGQLRYAQRIGKRMAFKITGGAMVADEFTADNFDPTALVLEPRNNPAGSALGNDVVNRYGDIGSNLPMTAGALAGKIVCLPGYTERELLSGDTQARNYKIAPSLSFLLTPTVKATAEYRYLRTSGAYADAPAKPNGKPGTVASGRGQLGSAGLFYQRQWGGDVFFAAAGQSARSDERAGQRN